MPDQALNMYFLIGILLCMCIFFCMFCFLRCSKMRVRVCRMEECEKISRLNELMNPFGFCYLPEQDIMTTTLDAWQREFGYCAFFDETAVHFNMVFDCEPVYFDYDGRTWLFEFWKGQYGLNTGAEVGIYRADTLLNQGERKRAVFQSVPDNELFPISLELYRHGKKQFSLMRKHWWLTGFCVGQYSEPEELAIRVSITFPNEEMLNCFYEGLQNAGYRECELCVGCRTVFFSVKTPHFRQPRRSVFGKGRWQQWKNLMFCRIFQLVTKPFTCTLDKILYLYYLLPGAFRRMLRFRKNVPLKRRRWRRA